MREKRKFLSLAHLANLMMMIAFSVAADVLGMTKPSLATTKIRRQIQNGCSMSAAPETAEKFSLISLLKCTELVLESSYYVFLYLR